MQNSNRPRRIIKPFGAAAGSGFIRTIPVAAQTGGAASYDTGFPPETFTPVASGGTPPSGQDMNGILFDATGSAAWAAAGGIAMFDADYAQSIGGYPMYALLASTTAGVLWQSTIDGNTGNPDSTQTGWAQITANANPGDNYYRLPSGIIEQWGEVILTSTGEPVVGATLPVPFATAFYNVSLTPLLTSAATNADTFVQMISSSRTTTGFSVQYQRPATSGGSYRLDGFMWRAVGR